MAKAKLEKVFSCTDCRKKFISLRALNTHHTKAHPEKSMKFELTKTNHVIAKKKRVVIPFVSNAC